MYTAQCRLLIPGTSTNEVSWSVVSLAKRSVGRKTDSYQRKDKTMVHILDTLTRLENKFDTLALGAGAAPSTDAGGLQPRKSISNTPSSLNSAAKSSLINSDDHQGFPRELEQGYQRLTVPHKIILWPSIYIHLINSGIQGTSDLQFVLQEGTPWFIRQEMAKHPDPLPYEAALPHFAINAALREQGRPWKVAFPTLTIQEIQGQCDAFFNTFNVLAPLLNRDAFMNDTVAPLLREGYGDGDIKAVLALLVFALGEVAIGGVFGNPISTIDGQPSGFRGGTVEKPPGLDIFNEARRRIGFVATMSSLENVQISLLEAMYYEANARHLDFWRATVAASMACQVLIKCQDIDWSTRTGDLIKRAYWTCILNEDFYHLDLDLPQTGIHSLEDEVPLPSFHESQETQGSGVTLTESRSHFQYHFMAMIALRRVVARINSTILECKYFQEWTSSATY